MGRLRRYRTAFNRYRHGKGFGIHSPFAFGFVLKVLRERLPYYAYGHIDELRSMVISRTRHHFRHPRIISSKNAKLIFRVTNFFNPLAILQIGTSYGVSTASMLAVSSRSQLTLCEHHFDRYPVTAEILEAYKGRIAICASLEEAIGRYDNRLLSARMQSTATNGNSNGLDAAQTDLVEETPRQKAARRALQPFILINNVESETDVKILEEYLGRLAEGNATVIMRNLSRNELMRRLWSSMCTRAEYGMAFSNDRIAVFVSNLKLPRQDFSIWF